MVAGLVLLLDRQPWYAGLWAGGGIAIGLFGLKVLRPVESPLLEWYQRLNPDAGRLRRMWMLRREGQMDAEEFERAIQEEEFWMSLILPPLAGLFHGVLFGAVVGTLCGLDSSLGVSACAGATRGLLVGPVLVALVTSMTLAYSVCFDRRLPLRVRFARRCLLVASPLLSIPAARYCVRQVVQRRGMA